MLFTNVIGVIASELKLSSGWEYLSFNQLNDNNYISIKHKSSDLILFGRYEKEKKHFVFDLVKFVKMFKDSSVKEDVIAKDKLETTGYLLIGF